MLPKGFEWIIIVVSTIFTLLPLVAIVLLIKVLWNRLRRDRASRQGSVTGGERDATAQQGAAARHSVPGAADDRTVSTLAPSEAARPEAACPRGPAEFIDDRAQVLEHALLDRGLTERERVIVMGIYAGKTHAELAQELYLSRSTVGTYCKRAYEKLGVADKDALVAYLDGVA